MTPQQRTESYLHRPWTSSATPAKILVIRFHALGDVIIALPYLQALKSAVPAAEMHVLTREECADIPRHSPLFTTVLAVDDRRNHTLLIAQCLSLIPVLRRERFDVVLDLQRNSLSRLIRRILAPKSFSEFDRFSPQRAGDRVKHAVEALHLTSIPDVPPVAELLTDDIDDRTWSAAGYSRGQNYIILNPAGSDSSKNWPITNYEQFARLWMSTVDPSARFMILGTGRIAEKAGYLKRRLGNVVVDLVNMTTAAEALYLLRNARLVLSEDSGLMHMAWTSRIPLVVLLGSTPSVWAAPVGNTSVCLDSSDLDCGCCDRPQCRFGDVRCLLRYSPEFVMESTLRLLERLGLEYGRHV